MTLDEIANRRKYFALATGGTENWCGTKLLRVEKAEKEDIEKYNVNNGVIAYVDHYQDYYIGYASDTTITLLKTAGYQSKGGMYVPHSNENQSRLNHIYPPLER